jgi:hypothetical protein
MPKYPRDRFDEVPRDLERVGAHRSEPRRGRGWVVVAWAALATGLLVGAGVVALGVLNDSFQFVAPSATSSAEAGDGATEPADAATDDAEGATDGATEAAGETPAVTPTPTATAADPSDVPASTTIAVLNATTTSGLAGRAATTLDTAGWTVGSQGNAPERSATSTVYYATAADRAAALGVAESLGVDATQQSTAFPGATITVVLGTDFSS